MTISCALLNASDQGFARASSSGSAVGNFQAFLISPREIIPNGVIVLKFQYTPML